MKFRSWKLATIIAVVLVAAFVDTNLHFHYFGYKDINKTDASQTSQNNSKSWTIPLTTTPTTPVAPNPTTQTPSPAQSQLSPQHQARDESNNVIGPTCGIYQTGEYPYCEDEPCPANFTGVEPNCEIEPCPAGETGLYPDCQPPVTYQPPTLTPYAPITPEPITVTPTQSCSSYGMIGTYPNCVEQ